MVQNVLEPFNVEVIKVTIKDKPSPTTGTTDHLRAAFDSLRQYALQERRIRELRSTILSRRGQGNLRRCFESWRTRVAAQKLERAKAERKMTPEKRIELLIGAVAEKQKEIAAAGERKLESKSAGESEIKGKKGTREGKANIGRRKTAGGYGTVEARNRLVAQNRLEARSRLEAQKAIIQEQRAKLAEQEKFIRELRMREMDEEARRTRGQTISVAKQALSQCDQRARRSLIHLMREQGCRLLYAWGWSWR